MKKYVMAMRNDGFKVEVKLITKIPVAKIWTVMSDFSSAERTSATVKTSPVISETKRGLGAVRKCTFADKSSVVEEIIQFKEEQYFRVLLTEYSMPMLSMEAEIGIKDLGDGNSELYMSMDYVVKFGPFGWLLGATIMPLQIRKMLKSVLSGIAYHAQTGKPILDQMPDEQELKLALGV
ncbi:MAG: SRPBCC family protein [Mariprofundales bacterium]